MNRFSLIIIVMMASAGAVHAHAQSATGGASLTVQRSLSVSMASPMRFERDAASAGIISETGLVADRPAVIRLNGDPGRAYQIRMSRAETQALENLTIWSANEGDISDRLGGRLDAEGRDVLHISGRLPQGSEGPAALPLSIDYD